MSADGNITEGRWKDDRYLIQETVEYPDGFYTGELFNRKK